MAKASSLRLAGLSVTLAVLSSGVVPAAAQSLLDASPSVVRTLPSESETILSTRAAATEEKQAATSGLVPFEQSASMFRLAGEDDVARFTFNLAPEQAGTGGQLVLSYRNAVSVLPDSSAMDIEINGKAAGTFRIASPNGFSTQKLAIASDLLVAGRNQVRLRARQFHRVDCSLEATYELWSELDPATSGFAAAKPHGFSSFDDLLTVARTKDGVTDVRLILPQTATGEMLNDAAPVLQTLALFLNRDDMVVSVGEKPGNGPGIDLFVSTDKTKAQSRASTGGGEELPHGFSVGDEGADGRARVSLRGTTRADISAQLLAAIRGPLKASLDSGIFANGTGTILADASSTYRLSDTGYETRVFSGRLSRTGFDMVMPADFYPAEYDTIGVRLHAATSPGLDRTAQFLVRVNDLVVTSYPFRNTQGEQFDGKLIELPLRAFRPGVNKVEFLAELPTATDAACSPQVRDDSRPRFILLQDTTIEVPALARIGRLPDIGAFAGNAYPYADGKPFDIVVARPDAQSAGAALTMMARLALAARAPLDADIRLGASNATTGRNALVITTDNAFADLGRAGKSPFPPIDAEATVAPSLGTDAMETAAIGSPALQGPPDGTDADDDSGALLDAFRKSTVQSQDQQSMTSKVGGWLATSGVRFGKWLNYESSANDISALKKGKSLLTLSQLPSPDGQSTWTVIRAQSPHDVAIGVRKLVEPAVWTRLSGGSATVETASLSVTTAPAPAHFVAGMTDQSPGNIRRLAAAWFSDNFQFYVLLVVLLMGVFALWLGRAVPRKGVRSDR